jgi:hypothetical protein
VPTRPSGWRSFLSETILITFLSLRSDMFLISR